MKKILPIIILAFSLLLSACGLDFESLPIEGLSNAMGRQREEKTPEGHLRTNFNLAGCSAWIGTNTERGLVLFDAQTPPGQIQEESLVLYGGGSMLMGEASANPDGNFSNGLVGEASATPDGNFTCSGMGQMLARPVQIGDQALVLAKMHLNEFSGSNSNGEEFVMDGSDIYGTLELNQRVDLQIHMLQINLEEDIPWTSIENFQCLGTTDTGVGDEDGEARKRPGRAKVFVEFEAEDIFGRSGLMSGGGTMLVGEATASPDGNFTCAAGQEGQMRAGRVMVGENNVNVLEIFFPELLLEDANGEQVVMSGGSTMHVGVYEEQADSDIASN